jgi:hypothetical protein
MRRSVSAQLQCSCKLCSLHPCVTPRSVFCCQVPVSIVLKSSHSNCSICAVEALAVIALNQALVRAAPEYW